MSWARSGLIIPSWNSAATRQGTRPCSPATWAARRARASVTSRSVAQASRLATPSASQSAAAACAVAARCSSRTCSARVIAAAANLPASTARPSPNAASARRTSERGSPGRPARATYASASAHAPAVIAVRASCRHRSAWASPRSPSSSASPRASASVARPTRVSTVTRSAVTAAGEPGSGTGLRGGRQQVLGAAQRAAGGVPTGQAQQERHRGVRLACLHEQFGGARLVVRARTLGEHSRHPPGQRRTLRRQQRRQHGVPGEGVRPAQNGPVGHQQRLPDGGAQGLRHVRLRGRGRRGEEPPVQLRAQHGRGVQDRPSRLGQLGKPARDERGEGRRDRGARRGEQLLDRERQPVGAEQQPLRLLVGDGSSARHAAASAATSRPPRRARCRVIVPGAAARRRAAWAGASSRAEQASRTGESAAAPARCSTSARVSSSAQCRSSRRSTQPGAVPSARRSSRSRPSARTTTGSALAWASIPPSTSSAQLGSSRARAAR